MHIIGWSTGSLLREGDKSNYPLAIELLNTTPFTAIEFGILSEKHLSIFLKYLPDLDISRFDRVSFHACKLNELTEKELLEQIEPVIERGWPIINHPDMITDYSLWRGLGDQLYIENMDSSKKFGRTVEEMEQILDNLPDASVCFDIGHAKQVDPTMKLGRELCIKFNEKIKEIHLSEVDVVTCGHEIISHNTLQLFGQITDVLPSSPIILECGPLTNMEKEVKYISSEFPLYGMPLRLRNEKEGF